MTKSILSALAGTLVFVGLLSAQAPTAAPRQGAPAAPPGAGRGGALPGTESGWSTFQGQCVGCHGIVTQIGTAPMAASIRQMTPERIYAALQGKAHHDRTLADIQAQRVAEFMGGRPLGSTDHGDARDMPNRCTANPEMTDPARSASWNGWGNDPGNMRFQPAAAAKLTGADVPRLKLKWAFGYPYGMTSNAQPTRSARYWITTSAQYHGPGS